MNVFAMVVLIVLIACITAIVKARYRAMEKGGGNLDDTERRALEHDRNEARAEIAELRERVKVLERIATDSNTLGATDTKRIAAEIDQLRHEQDR